MTRIVVGFVAALLLSAGAAGATPSVSKTYQDAIGEDPAGPDITTVEASSDGYVLTFHVAIPTNPIVTPDFRLRIWLDADDSLETGLTLEDGPTGLDHFLLVDPTRFRPDEALLYSCSGNTCAPVNPQSLDFSYASGATFTTDARSLGLARIDRVRFRIEVATGIGYDPITRQYDFTNWHSDTAPDAGEWTFAARPLRVSGFRATPAEPRAGRPLAMVLSVVDNQTGRPLVGGKVDCLLVLRGKHIAARAGGLTRGLATCRFVLPPGSAGKRFQATIRVTAQGATVGRSLTGRVL